jgi:hypothetical protein
LYLIISGETYLISCGLGPFPLTLTIEEHLLVLQWRSYTHYSLTLAADAEKYLLFVVGFTMW